MGFGAIGQIVLYGDVSINGSATISQQLWQNPSFLNAWHNYGAGYNAAGYFKDSMGIVHLKGLVAGGLGGTTIFVLPAGYRPTARQLHVTATNGAAPGRCDVLSSGEVVPVAGDTAWFSLDGITFQADTGFLLGQVILTPPPIIMKGVVP
jgi:hypothetical protein